MEKGTCVIDDLRKREHKNILFFGEKPNKTTTKSMAHQTPLVTQGAARRFLNISSNRRRGAVAGI